MIKAIIFDLDGTLIDTTQDITDACNEVLNEYGFNTFSNDEIQSKVGNGSLKLIERCLPESKQHLAQEVLDKYFIAYSKCYKNKSVPYEGVPELLKTLQERNILIACNTNKMSELCEDLLKDKFPEIIFFKIVGSSDNKPNKPDPYGCNEIIKEMNLNKNEVLYVGDSDVDVMTGKNANLITIACLWGFKEEEFLKQFNPDYLISTPSQLLEVIEEVEKL